MLEERYQQEIDSLPKENKEHIQVDRARAEKYRTTLIYIQEEIELCKQLLNIY